MALSKREKTIGIATGVIVGLLVLDSFVVRPYFESLDQLEQQHAQLTTRLNDAKQTIAMSDNARRRWNEYRAGGLQSDASSAENNLLNALPGWSQASRLTISSFRPDRMQSRLGVEEKNFQITAQGTLQAVSSFLYRIETSQLPLRVHELRIAARTEGTDDLTVQIRLSTIWEAAAANGRTVMASQSTP